MSDTKVREIQVIDKDNIKGFFGPYRWLSNFHLCIIRYEDMTYPSVENAYQAAKTMDKQLRKQFIGVTPSEAKKLGSTIPLRKDWEEVKIGVMSDLLKRKFTDPELREGLLLTGDKYLEETNWWGDCYWGVCNNKGENVLGKMLMTIRNRIFNSMKV